MNIQESERGRAGRHCPPITDLESCHNTGLVEAKCNISLRAKDKLRRLISYNFSNLNAYQLHYYGHTLFLNLDCVINIMGPI
jgi:hypothetical protein